MVGKIAERLSDLRESFAEVLVVPRIQDSFAARSDPNCAVAVEFNFVRPIWSVGEVRDQSAFHWRDEFSSSFRQRFPARCAGSSH